MRKFITIILFFTASTVYAQEHVSPKTQKNVDRLINYLVNDTVAYDRLVYMCDMFGPRLSGSQNLENALDWIIEEMKKDDFDSSYKEPVMVPHWVRGNEYCRMIKPRTENIPMLSLGGSIATPPEGITAPVLVVSSFDELEEKSEQAKGKIVLYNIPWKNYGQAVQYRFYGAFRAAQHGAVASLTRSTSPNSHRHPHTGVMFYSDTVKKIPHCAIPEEDSQFLARMQTRGITPVLKIYMEAETMPDFESSNIIAEIRGSEKPDEIIALGGHIDSWDVGSGAHDDASGCISAWQVIKAMKDLGIKPKRTLRCVMWANEENGLRGGRKYAENHKDEKHALAFEFDSGVFPPQEIKYKGPDSLFTIVRTFEDILKTIDDRIIVKDGGGGVDIRPLMKQGVPAMSLNTDDQGEYFEYHHSALDTPDKVDRNDFNRCVAAIAVAVYLYSELDINLIVN